MKNFWFDPTTVKTAALTAAPGETYVLTGLDLTCTGIVDSVVFSMTLWDASESAERSFASNVAIPAGSVLTWDTKIVLEPGDELRIVASADNTLNMIGCYLVLDAAA